MAWRDEFQTQADAATAQNQKALDEALAARKLAKVELPVEWLEERFAPAGPHKYNGADYYVAGSVESPNEPRPTALFVEDAERHLYVVDLKPRVLSTKRHLICGCGAPTGGGALMPRAIAYRLPPNRVLKGHISVSYKEKRVELAWTERDEHGQICPQPPSAAPSLPPPM